MNTYVVEGTNTNKDNNQEDSGNANPVILMKVSDNYPSLERSHLVWSILNMLFCNMIFGIVALVFSINTDTYNKTGNVLEAKLNSQKARTFNIVSTALGVFTIVVTIIYIIFIVITLYSQASSFQYNSIT